MPNAGTNQLIIQIIDTKEITISQIGSSKVAGTMIKSAGKCEESSSLLKSNVDSKKKGTMVQATLSTLFGKVAEKVGTHKLDTY